MRLHWLIPLFAATASFALAILVNRKGPRGSVRSVFTFLTCMLALWNLNAFVLYRIGDYDVVFTLGRILRIGGILMPPSILHLALTLKAGRATKWRSLIATDYAAAAVLAVANVMDLLVSDLQEFGWGYYSVGTEFYSFFTIFLLTNFALALTVIIRDYQTTPEPRVRLQLKFWLLGAFVALPLGVTNIFPAYGFPVYPLGNLSNVAWAGIVAYGIVRHRLMDVDLVITKGVAYAAVGFALIAPAFGVMLWLQWLSFGQIHSDFSFALLLMLLAIGVLFPALRLRAQSRIERSLFREKHEYRAALLRFARSMVRILDRERLLRELGGTLTATLRLERVVICLWDDREGSYAVRYTSGIPPVTEGFSEDHALVAALRRRDEGILRDELEASPDVSEATTAAEACRENGWEVCVPLAVSGRLKGFISLGRKRKLEAFYAEDLQLLATLAAEAAIALENARLYEELKKSREIIERTGRLSALGTLAAGIAHEIRNPLVSVQTFFQLAPERLHDEEFVTSFLKLTEGEVQRICDLIMELLTFAKSPTNVVREMDLDEAVDRTLGLLAPQARKQQVCLERDPAARLPLVQGEPDQVKQVLINIILNAIEATKPGGAVRVATRQVLHGGKAFCRVEVHDNGPGIPAEVLEDIFNPFFTTKDRGTGLGLSIAHQIVTEHGGFITVESEEGRGSDFFIHLPVPPANPDVVSTVGNGESFPQLAHR